MRESEELHPADLARRPRQGSLYRIVLSFIALREDSPIEGPCLGRPARPAIPDRHAGQGHSCKRAFSSARQRCVACVHGIRDVRSNLPSMLEILGIGKAVQLRGTDP
ncbi:hypothetical protein EVAR_15992_1 [Eumeta japonica]|uniref:Uncharacterized protein n=1 Tax=Eumeta variegata TaxID=151549 RepID=A0A4C1ULL7_EUMVA|nr:hypothetical protein EVAR_15992_1 [Eumeta japonica]